MLPLNRILININNNLNMKKLITGNPLIAFYVLNVILLLVIGGLNLYFFPSSLDYALMFPQWAPALSALVITGMTSGKNGVSGLFQKLSFRNISLKWSLVAMLIPVLCCSLSYILLMFVENGGCTTPVLTRTADSYAVCLAATIFGCYGEEIGWRGYMLPRLNRKYTLFVSSLLVGLFWGVWHMRFQIGLPAFGLFVLGVVCYSFIISWLCSKTRSNILVAIVFHTSINMSSLILFEHVLSDLTKQQTEAQAGNMHLYTSLYGIYFLIFAIPCLFVVKNMFGKGSINTISDTPEATTIIQG